MKATSRLLKSWRIKKGLTIEECATKLNIGKNSYNSYELNISKCRLDVIDKIINLLDGDYNEFLIAYQQDKYSQNSK